MRPRPVPGGERLLPGRIARLRTAASVARTVVGAPVGPGGAVGRPGRLSRSRRGSPALAAAVPARRDRALSARDQPSSPAVLPVQPELFALCGAGVGGVRASARILAGIPAVAAVPSRCGWRLRPGVTAEGPINSWCSAICSRSYRPDYVRQNPGSSRRHRCRTKALGNLCSAAICPGPRHHRYCRYIQPCSYNYRTTRGAALPQ
jgi:hypothetical protein